MSDEKRKEHEDENRDEQTGRGNAGGILGFFEMMRQSAAQTSSG